MCLYACKLLHVCGFLDLCLTPSLKKSGGGGVDCYTPPPPPHYPPFRIFLMRLGKYFHSVSLPSLYTPTRVSMKIGLKNDRRGPLNKNGDFFLFFFLLSCAFLQILLKHFRQKAILVSYIVKLHIN